MQDRPFRRAMRQMWVDCGVIIGNSYHPQVADTDLLRYSADSIAQKAGRFAAHFRAIRDTNRESAMAANRGDWEAAGAKNKLVHQACGDCHFEFWPLSARAFKKETLQGWYDSRDVFGDEEWGGQVFTAPTTVLLSMERMRGQMMATMQALKTKDKPAFLKATAAVNKFADKNLKIWEAIERQAKAIAQLARERKLEDVGERYTKLTRYCRDCHESSSDGRGLDPLPWPQE
jgi:hypothetical protein